MDMNIKNPAKHHAPAAIRKRIASLRKQLARSKKVKQLLQREQFLLDQIKATEPSAW